MALVKGGGVEERLPEEDMSGSLTALMQNPDGMSSGGVKKRVPSSLLGPVLPQLL